MSNIDIITVLIPTTLRPMCGGASKIGVSAPEVQSVFEVIDELYPGFADLVVDADGSLKRFVNVYVNDEDIRFLDAMATKLGDGDTVAIVPAVAGGA